MSLYNVQIGGLPQASDINQLIDMLTGKHDPGRISFAGPVANPSSTTGFSLQATLGTALGVGTYQYVFTYITGYYKSDGTLLQSGETLPTSALSVVTTSGNQNVTITLPTSTLYQSVIAFGIYRTAVNGSTFNKVGVVKVGSASFVDSVADAALTSAVPISNTTGAAMTSGPIMVNGGGTLANNGQFGLNLNSSDLLSVLNAYMATQAVDDTKGIHWLKSGKTPGSTSPSDYDTVRVIDGVLFINSRPVANYNNGGILWSGAVYPTSTQPVTPTKPINQCANGWCLVWSDYAPGVGPNDWDWCYSYIPKGTPGLTQGHIFAVPSTISASGTVVTVKALTISSTGIQGDDNNGNSNASENDVCLRYVLEY